MLHSLSASFTSDGGHFCLQRDVCSTCCQLLFPVVLVFLALLLQQWGEGQVTDAGPVLHLGPSAIFAEYADEIAAYL